MCGRGVGVFLLLAQGADAGKHLAFEQLEGGAATRGAEGELVGHLELLGCGHGVATAHDGGAIALGEAFSQGLGALGEGVELEHAQGAVPENGLGALDDAAEFLNGLVTDVDAHAISRHGTTFSPGSGAEGFGAFFELEGVAGVGGQDEGHTLGLGVGQNLVGEVELVGFDLGVAYIVALGGQEGVGHGTTDDEGLALLHELGEYLNLVGDLGTAHDDDKGLLGGAELAFEVFELTLDEEAHGRLLGKVGHTLGGGVGAVGRTESIVHIEGGIAEQGLGELGVVLLFLLVETDVVEQHHVTILQGLAGGGGGFTDGFGDEGNGLAQVAGEALGGSGQGELGLVAGSFGAAQVGAENEAGAVLEQVLDGGQSGHDAGIVGNLAILHGYVEVNAHEHFLAGDIQVAYSEFSHSYYCIVWLKFWG